MLEKTFALLNDIPGGTYVPAEKKCYDDAEVEQLSQILKRLLWAPSQIRKKLQQAGVTIIPCNFYSEIPSIEDIERSFDAPVQNFDLIFDDSGMKESSPSCTSSRTSSTRRVKPSAAGHTAGRATRSP